KSKTVTPSPAAASSGTAFAFDTPRRQRPTPQPLTEKRQAKKTPRGVADLYGSVNEGDVVNHNDKNSLLKLCCPDCNGSRDTCSPESLTAEYIRVYGKDHWDALHAMDRPVVTFPGSENDEHEEELSGDSQTTDDYNECFSSSESSTSSATRFRTPSRRKNSVSRKFWTKYQSGINTPAALFPNSEEPVESREYLSEIGQSDLTPKMRAILVDWLIELSEHFSFAPATLHLAITMADRVLASGPFSADEDQIDDDASYDENDDNFSFGSKCYKIRRSRYQLLGGACTWMACKLMELHAPKVRDIAYVSDGFYTVTQVKSMERRVCNALKFAFFQQPTPPQFLLEFLRASYEGDRLLNDGEEVTRCQHSFCGTHQFVTKSAFQELANYLLELGRLSFTPVSQKPSLLAAAAVYLARVTMNLRSQSKTSCDDTGFWTPTLRHYSGYSKDDLKETVLTIHAYQVTAESNTKLKAAFSKYRTRKRHRVALRTVVPRDHLLVGLDKEK
ncbi:MAG: hypothetical protein SGILL_009906, partial [Bacillariaceae sp.]